MQSPIIPNNSEKMEQEIDMNALGENIVSVLKTIYDREIPVDIYELGLIDDEVVNNGYEVKVLMSLKAPDGSEEQTLPKEDKETVTAIDMENDVEMELPLEPHWDKHMMSQEATLELGML